MDINKNKSTSFPINRSHVSYYSSMKNINNQDLNMQFKISTSSINKYEGGEDTHDKNTLIKKDDVNNKGNLRYSPILKKGANKKNTQKNISFFLKDMLLPLDNKQNNISTRHLKNNKCLVLEKIKDTEESDNINNLNSDIILINEDNSSSNYSEANAQIDKLCLNCSNKNNYKNENNVYILNSNFNNNTNESNNEEVMYSARSNLLNIFNKDNNNDDYKNIANTFNNNQMLIDLEGLVISSSKLLNNYEDKENLTSLNQITKSHGVNNENNKTKSIDESYQSIGYKSYFSLYSKASLTTFLTNTNKIKSTKSEKNRNNKSSYKSFSKLLNAVIMKDSRNSCNESINNDTSIFLHKRNSSKSYKNENNESYYNNTSYLNTNIMNNCEDSTEKKKELNKTKTYSKSKTPNRTFFHKLFSNSIIDKDTYSNQITEMTNKDSKIIRKNLSFNIKSKHKEGICSSELEELSTDDPNNINNEIISKILKNKDSSNTIRTDKTKNIINTMNTINTNNSNYFVNNLSSYKKRDNNLINFNLKFPPNMKKESKSSFITNSVKTKTSRTSSIFDSSRLYKKYIGNNSNKSNTNNITKNQITTKSLFFVNNNCQQSIKNKSNNNNKTINKTVSFLYNKSEFKNDTHNCSNDGILLNNKFISNASDSITSHSNRHTIITNPLNDYQSFNINQEETLIDFDYLDKHYLCSVFNDDKYEEYVENTLQAIHSLGNYMVSNDYKKQVKTILEKCEMKNTISINDDDKLTRDSFIFNKEIFFFHDHDNNNNTMTNASNSFSLPTSLKDILVLDLDETLIHSEYPINRSKAYDITLEYHNIGIFIRPGLIDFLITISKDFNLVMFSAGEKEYIQLILQTLKLRKYFYLILCKDQCIKINNNIYIKDLDMVMQFDSDYFDTKYDSNITSSREVIIVDNNLYSFAKHLNKGILVSSYTYGTEDEGLNDLLDFLCEFKSNKANYLRTLEEQIIEHICFEQLTLAILNSKSRNENENDNNNYDDANDNDNVTNNYESAEIVK